MSRRRGVQVVILCEDKAHERFFRKLVQRLGHRLIRVEVAPSGEGDASQWVLAHVAGEVRAHRSYANHLSSGLVVVVDGDDKGVARRKQSVDDTLHAAGLDRRGRGETILIAVPTWSIETWLLWLCGVRDLNEEESLKDRGKQEEGKGVVSVSAAVEAWMAPPDPNEPTVVPSLSDGRLEMDRLKHLDTTK